MSSHDLVVFVQAEPEWYGSGDQKWIRELRLANATARRPTKQKPNTVLVKLTLRIPDAAFMPLRPQAVIVIPDDMTHTEPIEVIVEDPS